MKRRVGARLGRCRIARAARARPAGPAVRRRTGAAALRSRRRRAWLGTDFVGRDVWQQVLPAAGRWCWSRVAATALAYLVVVPLGVVAATPRLLAGRAADAAARRAAGGAVAAADPAGRLARARRGRCSPCSSRWSTSRTWPGIVRAAAARGRRPAGRGGDAHAGRVVVARSPSATSDGRCCAPSPPTRASGSPARCTWWPRPPSSASGWRRTPPTGP